ncbi:MAG: hypothetical protein M1816_003238 [Peltula sp. TS41687]|nr:MAG: hypothetical protein M1816_003238 [Peltula sp. TS41687]
MTALWFSSALVEEVSKTDSNSIKSLSYHEKVALNVNDVVSLLRGALNPVEIGGRDKTWEDKLRIEAIKCFQNQMQIVTKEHQSWVFYSQRAYIDSAVTMSPLTSLTQLAMHCIAHEDLFETTVELFTDILANYAGYLNADDYGLLSSLFQSQWTEDRLSRLKNGDFGFDSLQFGRFLLAFGDATLQDLVRSPESVQSKQILSMLHDLLRCAGCAVVEDEMCSLALEFWTAFVEHMMDSVFAAGEKEPIWLNHAREHVVQTLEDSWKKIRIPELEIVTSWDDDVRKGFKDFRKDVADLVQASYSLLGARIFGKFVDMALLSLGHLAWGELEASLFYLNALSDSIAEGQAEDEDLKRLFGSSLFTTSLIPDADGPEKTRQTLVYLLGHYASFFERHTDYLPDALRFLFQCLEVPSLATNASKSIASLCSSCRQALTSELGGFIQHYETFLSGDSVDGTIKEKVLGAIACIIQALESDEPKPRFLRRLLVFVQKDVYTCLVHVGRQEMAEALESGTVALHSLTSIGKGMQELNDVPIDLDSDAPRSTFWDQGEGASIQAQIVKVVEQVFEAMPHNSAVVEASCAVFRTGFTELRPGPFVFPAQVTTRFLLRTSIHSPQLGQVLTTACALVSSHAGESSSRIDDEAKALLGHVVNFVHQSSDPQHDPEVAQNCVDLLSRLVPRYVNVMVGFEPQNLLQDLFIFTLNCLAAGDILPKRSAASFWASFVVLTDLPDHLQPAINHILQHLGPSLAEALMINYGGGASRSELDTVIEPLKKMVFKQAKAKMWLEAALCKNTFPSDKVDANEKRLFLQKVMSLRGAKGTNQVVKEFWLSCRGTNFAYAS